MTTPAELQVVVVVVVVAGENGGSSVVGGSLVFGVSKPGESLLGDRGDRGDLGRAYNEPAAPYPSI